MAKAKAPLRVLVKQLPEVINDLKRALELKPSKARLKYTGSLDIDNEGGWNAGAKASTPNAVDVIAGVGGVPVEVEAGLRGQHDNQGSADWELEVDFG